MATCIAMLIGPRVSVAASKQVDDTNGKVVGTVVVRDSQGSWLCSWCTVGAL
jgi:hypothetical protein